MFEVISAISDIVIAVAGFVVAVLCYKMEKSEQEKKEISEEKMSDSKKMVEKLVEETSKIKKPVDELNIFYSGIKMLRDYDLLQFIINETSNMLTTGDEFYHTIFELYRTMLKNEECFSISYGFDRYISAFRKFVNGYEATRKNLYEKYMALINYVKEHQKSGEDAVPSELTNLVNGILEKAYNYRDLYEELLPFCKELQIKYKDEN